MGQTETPTGPAGLPDTVCEQLCASRRRCLLLTLLDEDEQVPLADLAARVRAEERSERLEQITAAQRQRVMQDLYERHLPKLTAVGVVEFDSQLGKVRLREPEVRAAAKAALEQ